LRSGSSATAVAVPAADAAPSVMKRSVQSRAMTMRDDSAKMVAPDRVFLDYFAEKVL
jgi:hypothetical protein